MWRTAASLGPNHLAHDAPCRSLHPPPDSRPPGMDHSGIGGRTRRAARLPRLALLFFPAAPAGDSTRAFPLVAQAPRVGLLVLLQLVLAFHILPADGARDSLVIVAAITPASVTACAAAVTIAFTALIAAPIIRMTAPLTAWRNHQQDILTG